MLAGRQALPGDYQVRLTAGGRTLTEPLTVRMDPRVKTPGLALRQQFLLSKQLSDAMEVLVRRAAEKGEQEEDARLSAELRAIYSLLQASDAAPTVQVVRAAKDALARVR